MKTATKIKSPHAKFWALLKGTENYNEAYKEEIKTAWVTKYSLEATTSLSFFLETMPIRYNKMLNELEKEVTQLKKSTTDRGDRQRKKLFALIYEFCKHAGYKCDWIQAKKIACKACGVTNLNNTPESKLIAVIKAFEKNEASAWVTSVLNKAAEV